MYLYIKEPTLATVSLQPTTTTDQRQHCKQSIDELRIFYFFFVQLSREKQKKDVDATHHRCVTGQLQQRRNVSSVIKNKTACIE